MSAMISADRMDEIIGKNFQDASREELLVLQAQIEKRIKVLAESEINDLVVQLGKAASESGYDASTIIAKVRAKMTGKKTLGEPKYRHPDDVSKTWTGMGRQPNWVKEYLAQDGKSLDDLAIAA